MGLSLSQISPASLSTEMKKDLHESFDLNLPSQNAFFKNTVSHMKKDHTIKTYGSESARHAVKALESAAPNATAHIATHLRALTSTQEAFSLAAAMKTTPAKSISFSQVDLTASPQILTPLFNAGVKNTRAETLLFDASFRFDPQHHGNGENISTNVVTLLSNASPQKKISLLDNNFGDLPEHARERIKNALKEKNDHVSVLPTYDKTVDLSSFSQQADPSLYLNQLAQLMKDNAINSAFVPSSWIGEQGNDPAYISFSRPQNLIHLLAETYQNDDVKSEIIKRLKQLPENNLDLSSLRTVPQNALSGVMNALLSNGSTSVFLPRSWVNEAWTGTQHINFNNAHDLMRLLPYFQNTNSHDTLISKISSLLGSFKDFSMASYFSDEQIHKAISYTIKNNIENILIPPSWVNSSESGSAFINMRDTQKIISLLDHIPKHEFEKSRLLSQLETSKAAVLDFTSLTTFPGDFPSQVQTLEGDNKIQAVFKALSKSTVEKIVVPRSWLGSDETGNITIDLTDLRHLIWRYAEDPFSLSALLLPRLANVKRGNIDLSPLSFLTDDKRYNALNAAFKSYADSVTLPSSWLRREQEEPLEIQLNSIQGIIDHLADEPPILHRALLNRLRRATESKLDFTPLKDTPKLSYALFFEKLAKSSVQSAIFPGEWLHNPERGSVTLRLDDMQNILDHYNPQNGPGFTLPLFGHFVSRSKENFLDFSKLHDLHPQNVRYILQKLIRSNVKEANIPNRWLGLEDTASQKINLRNPNELMKFIEQKTPAHRPEIWAALIDLFVKSMERVDKKVFSLKSLSAVPEENRAAIMSYLGKSNIKTALFPVSWVNSPSPPKRPVHLDIKGIQDLGKSNLTQALYKDREKKIAEKNTYANILTFLQNVPSASKDSAEGLADAFYASKVFDKKTLSAMRRAVGSSLHSLDTAYGKKI